MMKAVEDAQISVADRHLKNRCSCPKIRCSVATNTLFPNRWTHRQKANKWARHVRAAARFGWKSKEFAVNSLLAGNFT
jgi:hypothetical protein